MKENSNYDRKSLRAVQGKTADFAELAKDCVAFSNAQGGTIDLGIEDGQTLPPPRQRIDDELSTKVIKEISGRTQGVALTTELLIAENGGAFLRLHIVRGRNGVAMTSKGQVYQRIGDSSSPISSEDLPHLVEERNGLAWEIQLTDFNWQDADPTKLSLLIGRLQESDRLSSFVKQKEMKELLDYFFLTDSDSDRLTWLGVLFLGKTSQRGRISNSPVVQCIKYDADGEKVNKWLWDDYSLAPDEIVNDIWQRVPEWQESTEVSDGMFRRSIPAYSEAVVRELLVNALVHRTYTMRGDIFINIHPDRLEVVNPGTLPLGITPQNILHKTRKRNEHFARLMFDLHLMEREGSGYDMMYETLLSQGKALPIVEEREDAVSVKVARRIIHAEVIKVMQHAEQNFDLKQKQLICLGLIAMHESLTASQLIHLLQLRNADELRPWLRGLLTKGIVEESPERSKSKRYSVCSDLLRKSHFKGKTSLKRVENYRIRELILEDLKIYHTAPLKDIRERIGVEIPPKKVREQLEQLCDEGKVKKVGSYRWTQYQCLLVEKTFG